MGGECVGAIVCKLDYHKKVAKRGYIAMLAVDSGHRKKRIGSTLVRRAINAMIAQDADEVREREESRPISLRRADRRQLRQYLSYLARARTDKRR